VIARLRARLAQEDGMTLIELLTAMSILGLVMLAVVVMYVGGLHAETDMNTRFQAQQNARLALSALRNEIGSACSVTVGTVTGETAGSQLTVVLPNSSPNPAVNSSACASGTTTTVIWCAASASLAAPYNLYRSTGATCSSSSGIKRATALKCAGTAAGCTAVFAKTTAATALPTVTVTFPVEANLTNTHGLYTLADTITARNAGVGS
jgi:prepilin-type N-terminal cleavage/methylation domain-containing protein